MKSILKNIRPIWIVAAVSLLLMVAVLGIAAGYLNSDAMHAKLIGTINRAIPGKIDMASHRVSLLSGRIVLNDLQLEDRQGRVVGKIERLKLALFWPALIWHEVRVTRIEIFRPDLDMRIDRQDRLNLMQAFVDDGRPPADPSDRKPWQVRIADLQLHEGRIAYHRPHAGQQVFTESVEVSGGLDLLNRSGHVRLSVGRIALQIGELQQEFKQLSMSASHQPDRKKPISLELRLPEADFQVHGRVDTRAAAPDLDLNYRFDVDLGQFRRWLPQEPAIAGRVRGRGTAKGSYDDPRMEMSLKVDDGRLESMAIDQLTAQLKLDRRIVNLTVAQIHSAGGRLDLSGSVNFQSMFARSWLQPTAGLDKLSYDFKVLGRDLEPALWPVDGLDWAGQWQADLAVSGSGLLDSTASGKASIDLKTLGLKPQSATTAQDGQVSTRLSWTGRILDVQVLDADLGRHALQAVGGLDFDTRHIHGNANITSSRLSELGELFGIVLPTGRGELKTTWQGEWTNPTVKATLLGQDLAIAGWRLGRLLAEAESKPDGSIQFSQLMLENQGSLLEGTGSMMLRKPNGRWHSDPPVTLTLSLQHLEPHDFRNLGPWRGKFNGQLRLIGTLLKPVAELDLDSGKAGWRTLAGTVQGRASWQDGRLDVPTLKLMIGQSQLHLKGMLAWKEPTRNAWTSDAYVKAQILDGDVRLQDLHPEFAGQLTADASLEGRFSDLRGKYSLNLNKVVTKVQKLSAVTVNGRLSSQRLDLDEVALHVLPGQALTGSGWYTWQGEYGLAFTGSDIELRHIDALQRAYPVEGLLTVDMQGQGSVQRPGINAKLMVAEPSIKSSQFDDFRVTFTIQDQVVDLDANLNFLLKAHGQLDSGDFHVDAHFDRADLTPYLALWADEQWAGRLSGDLKAAGNWRHLDRLAVDATVSAANLDYREVSLLTADPFKLSLQNGVLDLPGAPFKIMDQGRLNISASGPLSKDLKILADGRLPLAALAPFTDALADAQGEVMLKAATDGALSALQWQADLTLDGVGFAIPALAQTMQDLNGHLKVSPQALVVESVAGRLDGGQFTLNGRLGLDRLKPVQGELLINARNLPIQWPDVMDAVVSGDLRLAGEPRQALLSGHLDIVEGTYYKDLRLNLWSAVSQPRRAEKVRKRAAPPPWMEAVNLAVTVGYRNPFLVDNNLARLQVVPDLKLSGTLAKPILNGRAEVADGQIIFRGKSFDVKTGVVDFVNPYRIEPTLDVVGEARIRQWLVSLSLSGTPDRLAFKLTSDPPESDNDILSLILFGRTQTEFSRGDKSGSQTTTQMLAALVATAWGEDLKNTAGVDILEVDTGTEGTSEDPERIQVTVGKTLSRRLTIKYAVESTDGEMIQRAISEYRFLDQLLASGYQDNRGEYGGELLFRIEF